MKRLLLFSLLGAASCFHPAFSRAQGDTAAMKTGVDSVNRMLDHAVVRKDRALMEKYYGDDFFFLHSTGMTDTKKSWVKTALDPKTNYASREHDSVQVELHPNLAIVSGLLTVRPKPEGGKKPYRLRYIRVFAWRKSVWQLISHHSTAEVPAG